MIEVRTETMQQLAGLLASTVTEVASCPAGTPDRSQIVIESLAGGLYEVAFQRTVAGQVRDLPALVPELARLVLGPYLEAAVITAPQRSGFSQRSSRKRAKSVSAE